MAEAIDTAFVDIRPDFTGFAIEAERGIKQQLAAVSAASTVRVNPTGGQRGIKNAAGDITRASNATKGLTAANKQAATSAALMGGTVARSGAIASAGLVGIGVTAALAATKVATASIEFESAFAGVRKTVQATSTELAQIREDLLDLSTTIPVSATALANIAESAGQLGVSTPAIKDFTRVVAELGVTTNLTSEEAADSLARIANITQLPQSQFENLGSTVVALGNRMAATESEIVDFGRRIAGAGKQVGLSVPEILGIGSALASVGIEAEAGGSSISTTIATMAKAVSSGGKKLQGFADIAGVSANKFADEFKTKPAAAIVRFIEGISRIQKEGGNVFEALEKIGLGGIRVRQTLLNSAGAGDLLAKSLKIGTDAFKNNTALQREAGIRFQTTGSQIQLLRNEADRMAISIGDRLSPAVKSGARGLRDLLKGARESKTITNAVNSGFEAMGTIIGRVFDVFRDNKGTIKDILGDLGVVVQRALVALKPLAILLAGAFIVSLRAIIPVAKVVSSAVRLMSDAWVKAVSVIITSIDKFLGGLSFLAGAVGKIPKIGGKFKDAQEGIDTAREHLRGFVGDLKAADGTNINTSVTLQTPDAQLDTFLAKLQQAKSGLNLQTVPGAGPTFGLTPLAPPKPPKPPKEVKPVSEVPKAIAALEQRKQDQLQLAQARTQSLADDRVALQDLAAFYSQQAANLRLDANLRRGFLVKAEQARAEIRNIDNQITSTIQADSEARARNAIAAADATTRDKSDDISARRRLIVVLQQRVAAAKAAGAGVAEAQGALADAERDLTEKIKSQKADRLDLREEKARAAIQAAAATEKSLADDITAQRKLIAVMRARVAVAKATNQGVQAALANLKTEKGNLGKLLDARREKRDSVRQEAIEARVQLASFTEGISDDRKALKAEERYWQEKVNNEKRGSLARLKYQVELERTRKSLRELAGDLDKTAGTGTTIVDILTENAQAFAKFGSNIGRAGIDPLSGFDFNASLQAMLTRQGGGDPTAAARAKDPMQGFQGGVDRLVDALDRNTNAQTGGGNAPVGTTKVGAFDQNFQAGVVGARYNAMARFWDSARARRMAEESTSG